jgi:hypothetical protein
MKASSRIPHGPHADTVAPKPVSNFQILCKQVL